MEFPSPPPSFLPSSSVLGVEMGFGATSFLYKVVGAFVREGGQGVEGLKERSLQSGSWALPVRPCSVQRAWSEIPVTDGRERFLQGVSHKKTAWPEDDFLGNCICGRSE